MSISNNPATLHLRARQQRRALTPWELPLLLKPMHHYRKSKKPRKGPERAHFAAILSFVYRNRFAVASQVQRRFATFLKSDRTARRHLAEMESLGHLATAPTRSTSPLFPKVYFVTKRGLRTLREALAAKNKPGDICRADRARRQGYSAEHVLHEVLETEFLLAVWQTVEGRPDLELLTVQRRSLEKHRAFQVTGVAGQTRLKPDAMFLFRQECGGMMACFVELDTGSMSRQQIQQKYKRYGLWMKSSMGQGFLNELYRRLGASEPKPACRVLMIVQDRHGVDHSKRLEEMRRIAEVDAGLQSRVWLTTVAALIKYQQGKLPLDCEIWHRGPGAPDAVLRNLWPRMPVSPFRVGDIFHPDSPIG